MTIRRLTRNASLKTNYFNIRTNSAWEQCKLGEVAEIVGGGTPSTSIEEYWDGEINWYAPAELGEQRYADSSLRKITQAGYDNSSAKMLPANKTILFTSRAGIGNTAILRRSACTNQGFQSLVINDSADVDFVYSLSDEIKRKAEIMASGSTFLEISGKQLAEIDIQIPHLDEQRQIGAVFRSLDSLITLHQREGISAYKEAFVLTHQRNKFVRDVILLRLLLPGTIHAVKRMVLLIHPLRPAILASAEHEDSSSAGTGKLVIVPERDDFVRIAENLLALLIHTGVFRYRMGKVNLGTSQNRKPTRVLVVFTNALDAIASRMEHRANLGPSINSIKVETQGGHPEQHVIVQSLDVVFGIWAHVRFGNF